MLSEIDDLDVAQVTCEQDGTVHTDPSSHVNGHSSRGSGDGRMFQNIAREQENASRRPSGTMFQKVVHGSEIRNGIVFQNKSDLGWDPSGIPDGIEGWSSSWERTAIPDGIDVGFVHGIDGTNGTMEESSMSGTRGKRHSGNSLWMQEGEQETDIDQSHNPGDHNPEDTVI